MNEILQKKFVDWRQVFAENDNKDLLIMLVGCLLKIVKGFKNSKKQVVKIK